MSSSEGAKRIGRVLIAALLVGALAACGGPSGATQEQPGRQATARTRVQLDEVPRVHDEASAQTGIAGPNDETSEREANQEPREQIVNDDEVGATLPPSHDASAALPPLDFVIHSTEELIGDDESPAPMPAIHARYFREHGDCNGDECAKPEDSMPPGRVVSVRQEHSDLDPFMFVRRGHEDEILFHDEDLSDTLALPLVQVGEPLSVWSREARFAYVPRCHGNAQPCVHYGSVEALNEAHGLHEPQSGEPNIVFDPFPDDVTVRVGERNTERSTSILQLQNIAFDPAISGEDLGERVRHRGISVHALGRDADFGLVRLPDDRRLLWIFQAEARSGGAVLIGADGQELSRVEGTFADYHAYDGGHGAMSMALPIVEGDSLGLGFSYVGSSIAIVRQAESRQVVRMDAPRFRFSSAWVTTREGERLRPLEGARNIARDLASHDAASFRQEFEMRLHDERQENQARRSRESN